MIEERLPIRAQSFETMRTRNFKYVDKTDIVYKLGSSYNFYFLSRPRRFGKSLLLSTLEAYFQGRKELFEGLKIASLEKDWIKYPVFRFDLNWGRYRDPKGVEKIISNQLRIYEKTYKIPESSDDIYARFQTLILTAYEQCNEPIVVLIDEYEKPLLETIDDPELQKSHRSYLKPFYSMLKSFEQYIRFIMITGVSKLGHLSIFSDFNNIQDISLIPEYSTLCGFTEKEIRDNFSPYILQLCEKECWTYEETIDRLRKKYDGYRFSSEDIKVYNPYSLLNCFDLLKLNDYWFKTGTPSFLMHIFRNCHFKINKLEGIRVTEASMTEIDDDYSLPVPILYQSGYLTIVKYDKEISTAKEWYTLGFPNEEVYNGFFTGLLAYYTQKNIPDSESLINEIVACINEGNPNGLMKKIRSLLMSIPSSPREKYEYFFRDAVIIILKMIGINMQHEVKMLTGELDCVIESLENVYIIEFKTDRSVEEAMQQIIEKDYSAPYEGSEKKIFRIGVNFTTNPRNCQYIFNKV